MLRKNCGQEGEKKMKKEECGMEVANIFEKVALAAYDFLINKTEKTPLDAWKSAGSTILAHSTDMQEKPCPKNTFLSLCEEGLLRGIPKGKYMQRESVEKQYAITALKLIRADKNVLEENIKSLWEKACGDKNKHHDYQMNIVKMFVLKDKINYDNLAT
jgi:hypothetical protein